MTDTTTPVFTRPTVHLTRRRRRRGQLRLLVALLAVVLIAATVHVGRLLVDDLTGGDRSRDYLGTDGWPSQGQGAYRIGAEPPAASEDQRPAPIASLAKVMTAYLVLQAMPLADGDDGPSIDVTDADVADTERRRGQDESLVDLDASIDLTEREALMAVLLPSANNVAALLARTVSGSTERFVERMNQTAAELGMDDTIYTDPSGFDDGTVSTAADQLRLAETAAAHRTLAGMMATPTYWIPVAGEIRNTDSLLGVEGFVGMKTGSHDGAGGCFMFHVRRVVNGYEVDIVGVVMGQHGSGRLIDAALEAARQLADRVGPPAPTR